MANKAPSKFKRLTGALAAIGLVGIVFGFLAGVTIHPKIGLIVMQAGIVSLLFAAAFGVSILMNEYMEEPDHG